MDNKKIEEIKQNRDNEMRLLLYPCFIFDHAVGFALLTKNLVYNISNHLTELNPTENRSLHLDHTVIGNLYSICRGDSSNMRTNKTQALSTELEVLYALASSKVSSILLIGFSNSPANAR